MADEVVVESAKMQWEATKLPGVQVKYLRKDAATGGSTVLLKLEAEAVFPRHVHPGGEEVYVLEGRLRVEDRWYQAGDFVYSAPGTENDASTDTGVVVLVMVPKAVEFVRG